MPFKDLEQRKEYQRKYQALQRARLKAMDKISKGKADSPAPVPKVRRIVRVRIKRRRLPVWLYLVLIALLVLAVVALWKAYQVEDIVQYWFGG